MRRLERLVNLLAALIETDRPLSRAELHRRVPGYAEEDSAYRRAFERDKETLRGMGVPVVMEPLDPDYPDHGEGYRVPREQYAMRDPGLTPEEMQALGLAASAVKLKSQAAVAALWKLGGHPTSVATVADVSLSDDDRLGEVFAARSGKRRLHFIYKGTTRAVDPHRIAFRNGRWYLTGHDVAHGEVRTYRLDRIEGDLTTTEAADFVPSTRAAMPWLPGWQMGDAEPVAVQLLIDASQATFAVEQAGADVRVEHRDDGSVVLDLPVTNQEALFSFVLGFLDHAEILAPGDVRAAFVSYLRSFLTVEP